MSQQQVNRPAGEVLVEMRNMVKVFGPVVALGGVDITVRRGQVLGLIGGKRIRQVHRILYSGRNAACRQRRDALPRQAVAPRIHA